MKKIIIALLVITTLVLFFFTVYMALTTPKTQQNTTLISTITPYPGSTKTFPKSKELSSYIKTTVGSTTDKEVETIAGRKNKITLPDGSTEYTFESINLSSNDTIVTKNNTVVFEKANTIDSSYTHPRLSEYVTRYGKADAEFTGSKTYGKFTKTYVYATRGFALIANPYTEEINEIHSFLPQSIDSYVKTWGSDIKTFTEEDEEKL